VNVSLTPELEKFIDDRVASGQYRSASEVVREPSVCGNVKRKRRRHFVRPSMRDRFIGARRGISGGEALAYLRNRGRREASRYESTVHHRDRIITDPDIPVGLPIIRDFASRSRSSSTAADLPI
jgi:Arc/MetJ-type ribon-helix-helix transcriptional regulator